MKLSFIFLAAAFFVIFGLVVVGIFAALAFGLRRSRRGAMPPATQDSFAPFLFPPPGHNGSQQAVNPDAAIQDQSIPPVLDQNQQHHHHHHQQGHHQHSHPGVSHDAGGLSAPADTSGGGVSSGVDAGGASSGTVDSGGGNCG